MGDLSTTISLALAGVPIVGTATGWAIRSYVKSEVSRVDSRFTAHEREDSVIHENVKTSLEDLKTATRDANAKLDRLIERL